MSTPPASDTQIGAMYTFATTWGDFGISFYRGALSSLHLPGHDLCKNPLDEATNSAHQSIAAQVRSYIAGDTTTFDVELYTSAGTEFQQKVWAILLKIPYGHVLTYSQVAERMNHPGAARAVGSACGCNPIPLIIPCHRVVAAGGAIGGFSASAGLSFKRKLLAREGITLA